MVWKVGKMDAYQLLAQLLLEEKGMASLPGMTRGERGKPRFPAYPALCFNVSHSGDLSLCALGEKDVGCDIELVRPRSGGLPAYVLDEGELDWFRARGGRWEDLYTLWTLKEARVKCTGQGLNAPPRAISVPLMEPGESAQREGFRFTALAGEGWRGAVCEKL